MVESATGEFILKYPKTVGTGPEKEYVLSTSAPGEQAIEASPWDSYHAGTEIVRFLQEYKNLKKGRKIRFATVLRPGAAYYDAFHGSTG